MKPKEYYTRMMCGDYIERSEKVSKCEHCGSEIKTVYEKDNTPGFRSSDTYVYYNCDCRHYVGKTSKEVFESMKEKYDEDVQYYKNKYDVDMKERYKERSTLYEEINFLKVYTFSDCIECKNCEVEQEKSEFIECRECNNFMCKKCVEKERYDINEYGCSECQRDDY